MEAFVKMHGIAPEGALPPAVVPFMVITAVKAKLHGVVLPLATHYENATRPEMAEE